MCQILLASVAAFVAYTWIELHILYDEVHSRSPYPPLLLLAPPSQSTPALTTILSVLDCLVIGRVARRQLMRF